ncbi:MAG: DUF1697 domain-containing protein [Pseudomonadota bacterium]
MALYASFIRGINVGGHGKLPMKPFCAALEVAGLKNVRSYIQSGNIACEAATDPTAIISDVMETGFSLTRPIHTLTAAKLSALIAACPFADADAKRVLIYLHPGMADLAKLTPLAATDEKLTPGEGCTYLHAPSGIGRSKLAAKADKALPQPVTARNLATLRATASLLR